MSAGSAARRDENPGAARHLRLSKLGHRYRVGLQEIVALHDVDLHVAHGEIVSIVGQSGCGKSTLLRIIAGLETRYSGEARWGDTLIRGPSPERRMVFQEHRLFPWLTVAENIAFALRDRPAPERDAIVHQHIDRVGLRGFEHAYPRQLSGGMAQRAAIARALAGRPDVLLLDEPFGALDALTRLQMQQELERIWAAERTTMILVTHDIEEAVFLGQRVITLSSRPGTIQSIVPIDLPRPRDRSSPEFVEIRKAVLAQFRER